MKVLVLGGIGFQDRNWLWGGLDLLNGMTPISEIIEGGEPGASVRAQEWACRHEVRCVTVPKRWGKEGPSAPMVQAEEFGRLQPHITLVCPDADADVVAVVQAHQLKIVRLEKMPVAKGAPPVLGRPLAA